MQKKRGKIKAIKESGGYKNMSQVINHARCKELIMENEIVSIARDGNANGDEPRFRD